MSKYTIISKKEADSIIQDELNIIVDELLKAAQNWIKAILLTGGFGRGEGAVVREGNFYRPVNDYDIIVIVKQWRKIPDQIKNNLTKLNDELTSKLSVKQVDLGFIDEWKLALPGSSIARYEIKKGFIKLYGSGKITIRSFPRKLIPLHEATTYFRTRGSGLLIARLLMDNNNYINERKQIELALIEINKAFLAIGDAYLIQHRLYHYSYVVRLKYIKKNAKKIKIPQNIRELYVDAINTKLSPNFDKFTKKIANDEWLLAAEIIIEQFLRFEGIRFKKIFKSIENYAEFVLKKKFFINFLIKKAMEKYNKEDSSIYKKQRIVMMSLLYAKLNNSDLYFPRKLLNSDSIEWDSLVKTYLKQWHPSGIVSEITK